MIDDPFSKTQITTVLVLLAWLLLLLAYDLVVFTWIDDQASISQVVYKLCRRAPIVAFLLGLAVGHLLWPIHRTQKPDQRQASPTTLETYTEQNNSNGAG